MWHANPRHKTKTIGPSGEGPGVSLNRIFHERGTSTHVGWTAEQTPVVLN
jgi:hypothetical protein